MSILIKGMEMPTSCESCMFSRRSIHNIDWCVLTEKDLPCDCPLVPVPPHGRLIDETNILKVFSKEVWGFHTDFAKGIQSVFTEINAAPTIIPAEEGER